MKNLNNWKYKTAPQKGHNMAIAEWVLPNGQRADYALFKGREFYGIVEAKKMGSRYCRSNGATQRVLS